MKRIGMKMENYSKTEIKKTITINSENLAKKLVLSYKYNTPEEYKAVGRTIAWIVGVDMFDEVCEIFTKMIEEQK